MACADASTPAAAASAAASAPVSSPVDVTPRVIISMGSNPACTPRDLIPPSKNVFLLNKLISHLTVLYVNHGINLTPCIYRRACCID